MVTRSDKTNDSLDNEIVLDAVYHPLVHGDLHGSLSMSSRPIFRKAPTNSFALLKLKNQNFFKNLLPSEMQSFCLRRMSSRCYPLPERQGRQYRKYGSLSRDQSQRM